MGKKMKRLAEHMEFVLLFACVAGGLIGWPLYNWLAA